MKRFIIVFCAVLILSTSACAASKLPEETQPSETVQTIPYEQDEAAFAEVDIDTKYYTLALPEDWDGTCVYNITNREDGTYTLTLYEKFSYEEGVGGKLCDVMLLPADEDYSQFPSYDYLCMLSTPDIDYNVVILYPTDVQFNEETFNIYSAMSMDIFGVLNSLEPKDGIDFVMP